MRNNIRFDLSDYLIHFFRDVDLESDSHIDFPEFCGFNNLHHSSRLDALFLMRIALRHGKLFASWSYRNGLRTIYGNCPTVCFTDMPLAAFIQTSEERLSRGEKISNYAFLFPKKDMFKLGARPVIYGLAGLNLPYISPNIEGERTLDSALLPVHEQYRYVTYNPVSSRPIDWTHEREWRWPYTESIDEFRHNLYEEGVIEDFSSHPAFYFINSDIEDCGVIVKTESDKNKVLFDILTIIDRGVISKKFFSFIISLDQLGCSANFISPSAMSELINKNAINIDDFFKISRKTAIINRDLITKIVNSEFSNEDWNIPNYANEVGKSWVWFISNQTNLVRSLIKMKLIRVNREGRYLLDIDPLLNSEYPLESYPLKMQEEICKKIALSLTERFGVNCTYFSVAFSDNFDNLPYYTNFIDNHEFYNETIECDW
ncbi:MAG: DUF4427 domain-containing protein [Thiothrix sp.]|uniref:DUF4427 domain-containing protein n=1 Tax=Thiothrix sp. TaxID=1032 RepID=UPI00260C216B|nr:DUF4427 domain-containing protein [Thiothrix sp.]MDD5395294.1 DUF4427 domain-containing protein [Thiothrix sp.]